ncbi:DUF1799 domain-containing protein [Massilia sp. YIM B02763]|uniref:DUF1799 domain-containing protein n=1 Tax=Massilia sp. YIM B02763 TaxID=3050130 RepID=UPI0025B68F44|nr:DUF1799 domain-containing protein [Massilia sp. YIM B02763]MDN4052910.1 DUF1799 domain-containing protein [Massilia sp. YIM B02763]
MFTPPPSEHELAAAGLTLEDLQGADVEIWPENQGAYFLFAQLQTQWRTGMSGATGLDYNTLFHKMDRMGLEPDEYEDLEDDVRTMEFAALEAMNKKD